jgi:uncharacterized protein
MKSKIFMICLMPFFIFPVCTSQTSPSHRKAALELLDLMNMEATLKQGVDIALASQIKANPNLQPYEDVMQKFLSKYMSWEYLKERFIKIYTDEFSESDLRSLIVFYRTDVGKKTMEKLPILYAKGSELGSQAVQEHVSELTDAINERAKQLNH